MVALRWLKWRIVIALQPSCIVTPVVLEQIPPLFNPLLHHFKHAKVAVEKGKRRRARDRCQKRSR
jgi:hypothetical protein